MEFLKKKVLVVGLGVSGLSAARWLSKSGADVKIADVKAEIDLDQKLLESAGKLGINIETGGHREESFTCSDMIVLSPGVPLEIGPLKAARERGVKVIGEMGLASGLFDTPIVAVTGTNGKSTTVSILEYMIKGSGAKVFVGGNIGTPLMDYVAGEMDADYVLVEVSSFQLDSMDEFRPAVSLLLNISPDHLDRYVNYEAYVQSKLKIFKNQGRGHYAILNDDDERLSRVRLTGEMSVLRYGMEKRSGLNAFSEGNKLVARLPGEETHYFETDRFRLPGRHNIENLMGAVLAGLALRIDPAVISESIDNFKGLSHRVELIGSVGGIDFYDDSKATNVDAALRSLQSFDRQVVLIAGGRHKGGDYKPLVEASEGRVKKAIFLGEAKELMARSFEGVVPFTLAGSMRDAVSKAFSSADPGDVVLLAPACSSFDMFSSYAHRGSVFREEVERLNNGS